MLYSPTARTVQCMTVQTIPAPFALGIDEITIATAIAAFLDIGPRLSFATDDGFTVWMTAAAFAVALASVVLLVKAKLCLAFLDIAGYA